jgi:hypothetical protein
MQPIFRGRYTAQIEGPFVVFIIGMRINRLLAVHKWLPVVRAMPRMLDELKAHGDLGLLHAHGFRYARGGAFVQYWRSFDDLDRFARDPGASHLPAWKDFNRRVAADGTVGIWHETYLVQAGQYECVYGNMPRFGLAMACNHVPATGSRETARRRLGMHNEPAVPTYENPEDR